ncbi:STAS domain-containing protein [Oceanobacillus sp. Castelsardo]|uniref:STAS domain-containing protein n=1 Tax=Oceanobacillus sp. Castelsardo TaxID=1851204 RepID=UPI00083992DC|nr:STAS domain-containing protein [Oceanobacillus sp. Castelsardo]
MKLKYKDNMTIKHFIIENQDVFKRELLEEAINVRDKIEEIKLLGNINLVENALTVVLYVVDELEDKVIKFGNQEGVAWAKHDLTLALKVEWIQAIRTTLWNFLYDYDQLNSHSINSDEFFRMGKEINSLIDEFFKGFFISYSNYKDELIEAQRKLVENLSVPMIPISSTTSIIPLIGTMDEIRMKVIEEKILMQIGEKSIQTLILDLSGVVQIDTEALKHTSRFLDGIVMMGCKPIITGIRPDIVKKIVELNIRLKDKAEIRATLQQALDNYLIPDRAL